MSELATLARPYAAAAFKRAKDTSATAKWSDSLSFLSALIRNDDMRSAVANPKIGKDRLAAIVMDLCVDHVDKEGLNFVQLLLENGRMILLPEIAAIFEEMRAADEGFVEVDVFTAFPLDKSNLDTLNAKLEKVLRKKVHMQVAEDKSLIGGVLVRAGDRVFDGSVKGQLQNLRKALQ